jgi:hypothetical protein
MPQILMVVGALLALAGIGGIAAGAPDWLLGLSLGATLIQSGMIAFVGGLLLIAIALVLYALQDLLHRLETMSANVPARPAAASREPRSLPGPETPAARPRPAAAGEPAQRSREEAPSASAEEHVRPRREAPSRFGPEEPARQRAEAGREYLAEEPLRPRRETPPIISGEEPRPRRETAQGLGFEEQAARSRRERSLEQTGQDIERLRSESPLRTSRDASTRPRRDTALPQLPALPPLAGEERRRPRLAGEEPGAAPAETYVPKFRPAEPAPKSERHPPSETVVKSGVIGGMAYTLYADGSIEAELPIGTVRFASISELQDHVTRTGAEADTDFDESNR